MDSAARFSTATLLHVRGIRVTTTDCIDDLLWHTTALLLLLARPTYAWRVWFELDLVLLASNVESRIFCELTHRRHHIVLATEHAIGSACTKQDIN